MVYDQPSDPPEIALAYRAAPTVRQLLEGRGIEVNIDGRWGVDALLLWCISPGDSE